MESSDLPTEHKPLSQPPLKYVAAVLEVLLLVDVILFIFFEQQAGLRENFAEATVTVEECPDLRWIIVSFLLQTHPSSDRHHGALQDLDWEERRGNLSDKTRKA